MQRLAAFTRVIGDGRTNLWSIVDIGNLQGQVLAGYTTTIVAGSNAECEIVNIVVSRGTAKGAISRVKVKPFRQGFAVSLCSAVTQGIAIGIMECICRNGILPA